LLDYFKSKGIKITFDESANIQDDEEDDEEEDDEEIQDEDEGDMNVNIRLLLI